MEPNLIKHFEDVLREASGHRKKREDWIEFERRAMWNAVNDQRRHRGKNPLPIEEVARVEGLAVGHSDYAHKFAIDCAELVLAPNESHPTACQEALHQLTEWNLATLEGALGVKRTPKCEIHRLSSIAYQSLLLCRSLASAPPKKRHVRTCQWLDQIPQCPPEDFHKHLSKP